MQNKIRYSPSTGVFYPLNIEYAILPGDIIEVEQALFDQAMARPVGQHFSIDAAGSLSVFAPPAAPIAQVRAQAMAEVRRQRATIMATLDGIAGRMYRAGEVEISQEIDNAIEALLDITALPALVNGTDYASMKASVLLTYKTIAAQAPAVVRSAFLEAISA